MGILTLDNFQLSRSSLETKHHSVAVNCKRPTYMDFVQKNLAPATHAAYRSDLRMYRAAGGKIPATPE